MLIFKHQKGNHISIVEHTDPEFHRSKIVIHRGTGFYYAEFSTIEQLQFHADLLGFKYSLKCEEKTERFGLYQLYEMTHSIDDHHTFSKISDIPEDAKPFKALSNGSIVTCYFTNHDKKINIYRPNPNAKEVYKPLELVCHLKHKEIYGSYWVVLEYMMKQVFYVWK